jgi:glutathione-regulated potassium-efflux system ancillary protein KefF
MATAVKIISRFCILTWSAVALGSKYRLIRRMLMSSIANIVVYFAHLAIETSVINRTLRDSISDLPNVNFRDLHELYPDFFIDTATEQSIMRDADLIVFQHPIYWYAAPAIFKHMQDTVLLRGFAYGPGGTALHGKDFMLAVSTGAPAEEYGPGGIHHYAFEDLIRPIEQTARFCGMNFMSPLVLQGGHGLSREAIDSHASRYRQILEDYQPATGKRK